MTRRTYIVMGFVCIIVGTIGGVLAAETHRASAFYSEALKNASISEFVTVDSSRYYVSHGTVSNASKIGFFERFRALKLTYALMLARRSPFFGIEGTDPQALRDAVRDLEHAQLLLSAEQQSAAERELIKALYPTAFLDSLASLEDARQKFISSGSDRDSAHYDEALRKTAAVFLRDAQLFSHAFKTAVATSTYRFALLGNPITNESMQSAIETLNKRADETNTKITDRKRCLLGNVGACDDREIGLSVPEDQPALPGHVVYVPHLVRDSVKTDRLVALSASTCLENEPGPYVFLRTNIPGPSRVPILYSSELFFTATEGRGGTLGYFSDTLGIKYLPYGPLTYYVCPDSLRDIGSVHAVLETERFAMAHPSYAEAERSLMRSHTIVREPEAIAYVKQTASEITARELSRGDPVLTDFEALLNLWQEKSAGLDEYVAAIASISEENARRHENGIPVDVSALTLFLTHSAFPSLYLTHNPSAGDSPLSLRTDPVPTDVEKSKKIYLRFTDLVRAVPRAELARDTQTYLSFEGLIRREE